MSRSRTFALAGVLLLALAGFSRPAPRVFHFIPGAGVLLHRLWDGSVSAKSEQVACLSAKIEGDTVQIYDVLPLSPSRSDSMGVSAGASLEACGPPNWLGTVHTHVALRDGLQPYSLFSGADRGVMMMWWRRWGVDGLFCLLYSDKDVICEIQGPETVVIFPRSRY
ncbi:MAG TPA: hypothetical protein VFH40_16345 [Gemmatimonadales bacterium]|nr:hypothetical protein [Gemmatimonadales bacterium]